MVVCSKENHSAEILYAISLTMNGDMHVKVSNAGIATRV
jgi:hypothetical protein